jgi:hypothetical protein
VRLVIAFILVCVSLGSGYLNLALFLQKQYLAAASMLGPGMGMLLLAFYIVARCGNSS